MDLFTAGIIIIGTMIILLLSCYKCATEVKLMFIILTAGIFVYSGLGISQTSVNNIYTIHYFIFLIVLLFTIRLICSRRVFFTFGKSVYNSERRERLADRIEKSLDGMNKAIILFTVLFFVAHLFNMVYPTNRLFSMFNFSNFTSRGIHARRAEHNSYVLLKLTDTISTATLPFFFVYLYNCAIGIKRKKIFGFILCIFWIILEFGEYNYLSRYELVIYLGFIVMYFIVCKYKEIKIDKKTIAFIGVAVIILIPALVSFTDVRLGRSVTHLSFSESLSALLEDESNYPKYYDICIQNSGLVDPIQYLLWIIFLPIPSALWSGKPVVQIAYSFTGLFYSTSVTASNYSNLLPSVLGESFLIFGQYLFWVEAIILGIVIGIYFNYFIQSKKLSLLTAYMLLMLATIGRGGSQSYISVIINGSIVLILWIYIAKIIRKRGKVSN